VLVVYLQLAANVGGILVLEVLVIQVLVEDSMRALVEAYTQALVEAYTQAQVGACILVLEAECILVLEVDSILVLEADCTQALEAVFTLALQLKMVIKGHGVHALLVQQKRHGSEIIALIENCNVTKGFLSTK